MDDQLRLLTVHAHPDDESSKGAGTIARYAAEGVGGVIRRTSSGFERDWHETFRGRSQVEL